MAGLSEVAVEPLNGAAPKLFMIGQFSSSPYSRLVESSPKTMTLGNFWWMTLASASSAVQLDGACGLSPASLRIFLLYQSASGPTVHGMATSCPPILLSDSSLGMIDCWNELLAKLLSGCSPPVASAV